MLRAILVTLIVLAGLFYSAQSPFYALLFYFWMAYFRPETWIWSDFLSQFNLSLIVGSFVILAALPSIGRLRFTWRLVLMLLFFGQSVISLYYSENPEWSWWYWVDFVKVIVIALVMTMLIFDERRYRLALVTIAFSLGFETAKQGWAQLVLNPGATNANTHPMLGDNNGVALGVLMLVPVFVALAQTTTVRWQKFLCRFFVVGLVYRAISTYSRGGFLAGGVLAAIMLWRSPHKIRAIVSTVVLVGVIASVMPDAYWDRMNTINASEDDRDSSAQGRLHFWYVATRMAAAKPLTGVGFNGFRPSFGDYNDQEGWGDDRAVHSSWFGTLAEMGYPGLILMLAILGGSLVSCGRIKAKARRAGQPAIAIYAANMQATLLVYVTGATFLSAHYLEMYWHMIALTIALEHIQASSAPATSGLFDETVGPRASSVAASLQPAILQQTSRARGERIAR